MSASQDRQTVVFEAHTVHMAVQRAPTQHGLYWIALDGSPMRTLFASPRQADDAFEIGMAVNGAVVPLSSMAVELEAGRLDDGRGVRFWQVRTATGQDWILAGIEGEDQARLVPDRDAVQVWIDTLERESREADAQRELARIRQEDEERLRTERQARFDEVVGRPEVKERIQAILDESGTSAFMPDLVPVSDQEDAVSGYYVRGWIPQGDSWPEIGGHPAVLVLQLDVSGLPEAGRDLLGGKGMLQFFYAPWADDYDTQAGMVLRRVHPDQGGGAYMDRPSSSIDSDWYITSDRRSGIAGWREVRERGGRESDRRLDDLADELGLEGDLLDGGEGDSAYVDKLLGVPFHCQGDNTPETNGVSWIALYQIVFDQGPAEGLCAGDGQGHIYVHPQDPDRMVFLWQCG